MSNLIYYIEAKPATQKEPYIAIELRGSLGVEGVKEKSIDGTGAPSSFTVDKKQLLALDYSLMSTNLSFTHTYRMFLTYIRRQSQT